MKCEHGMNEDNCRFCWANKISKQATSGKIQIQPEATNHIQLIFGDMVLDVLATDFRDSVQVDIRRKNAGETLLDSDGSVSFIRKRK